MSKAISFGFGKSKTNGPTLQKPPPPSKKSQGTLLRTHDSEDEDEPEPAHESVAGFSSDGVILSKPVQPKEVKIIQNSGNGDWRNRGRTTNLLPSEVQAARNGEAVLVEKDEVSTASGLQYAAPQKDSNGPPAVDATTGYKPTTTQTNEPPTPMTEDEIALAALLDSDRPKSNAIITTQGNARLTGQDETADFRDDVATRPDSCTLEEYAAMPVEEFGMAMLRGMGQKRKAAGHVIDLEGEKQPDAKKQRKQEGFLGIGAKNAPGVGVELGAWGKADMRKNNRGEGFFTPLMRENKATGERVTEEEFQRRIREAKGGRGQKGKEEDWRERRDRNLERSGRDGKERERDGSRRNGEQKAITNGSDHESSRQSSSSRREREDRDDEERARSSRRTRDDREYDSSRSRRDRSRSKERRRRRDDDDDYDSRHREKQRDRYRDDERYESSSSHRSKHRERDRDGDRRHRDRR